MKTIQYIIENNGSEDSSFLNIELTTKDAELLEKIFNSTWWIDTGNYAPNIEILPFDVKHEAAKFAIHSTLNPYT